MCGGGGGWLLNVTWQRLHKEPGLGMSSTLPQQIMQFAKWEVGPQCTHPFLPLSLFRATPP